MILLDTHIWVWWVTRHTDLPEPLRAAVESNVANGLGLSVFSCWEVAKLVEHDKMQFTEPVDKWMEQALTYPGLNLLELTPQIAVASTQLPGQFHRDPADQIIVATARVYGIPLLTVDRQILAYPHVQKVEV